MPRPSDRRSWSSWYPRRHGRRQQSNMETQRPAIKILLVDDHVLFREGAARLLTTEADFQVVAHCGSVEEAIQTLAGIAVDLVLLDLDLGKERGFDFFEPARKMGFQGPILIV